MHVAFLSGLSLVVEHWESIRVPVIKVCLAKKDITFCNVPFMTICGHFIVKYMNIFHKTEVPTVILRCIKVSKS